MISEIQATLCGYLEADASPKNSITPLSEIQTILFGYLETDALPQKPIEPDTKPTKQSKLKGKDMKKVVEEIRRGEMTMMDRHEAYTEYIHQTDCAPDYGCQVDCVHASVRARLRDSQR
jgi:hypothetical protein